MTTNDYLRSQLTPLQYSCTQEGATETPFQNEYWNNKQDGIYLDIVTGEALFLSLDKYDSGSGWPSFTKPISSNSLRELDDYKLGMKRTEIKSSKGDSHLGHLFPDGPKDQGGLRYCINSASLKFVPFEKMQSADLDIYMFQFKEKRNLKELTIAGGCFWGLEELFRNEKGILATVVGYVGGQGKADYENVKRGNTGHAEAVRILYDPKILEYEKVLDLFFTFHDPTTLNRQGNDIGSQYRSTIFTKDKVEQAIAHQLIKKYEGEKYWNKKITTTIEENTDFHSGEIYHQKFLKRNKGGYTCHFKREFK